MGCGALPRLEHLPAKLLAIRRLLGLSQLGMARQLGVPSPELFARRLSEFESGRRQPNMLILLAYARAAKIPLENIVDDDLKLESK